MIATATGAEDDDDIQIELSVWTNKVGSTSKDTITVPREEWDEMNDRERNQYLFEVLADSHLFDWNYHEC